MEDYADIADNFFSTRVPRNVAAEVGATGPPTVKIISATPIPTSASLEPFHGARIVGENLGDFRECLKAAQNLDGPMLLEHHAHLFDRVAFTRTEQCISNLMSSRFDPTPSQGRARPVMHVPTYTVLNEMFERIPAGGRVLCVAPGKAEVGRVVGHKEKHFKTKKIHLRFVVPATSTVLCTTKDMDVAKPSDLRSYLQTQQHSQAYDAVFVPFSFGQLLEENGTRAEMLGILRSMVREGGGIYGLFYDVDDLRRYSLSESFSGSFTTSILSDHPHKGTEGSVITSVEGHVFCDYRLTPEALEKLIPSCDEHYVHTARYYMTSVHQPTPEFRKTALDKRLESIRVFRWFVKKEPMADDLVINEICDPFPLGINIDDDDVLRDIQPNRGRPFNSTDLFFVQPDRMFVTPKADGREMIIAWDANGEAHVRLRGESSALGLPWRGPPNSAIQLEYIANTGGVPFYVLADVLKGAASDSGYYSRMMWFRRLQRDYGLDFILFPPMYRLDSDHLPIQDKYPSDGFVLNFDYSPPGMFRTGFGAARYLKARYTKEIRHADGIYEAYIDNDQIVCDPYGQPRRRYDKTDPSSNEEIAMLERSWTIEKFQRVLKVVETEPNTLMKKMKDGPNRDGCFSFTDEELVYLWAPWRKQTIETIAFGLHGINGLMALKSAMVSGLFKTAAELGHQTETPPQFAKKPRRGKGPDSPDIATHWGIAVEDAFPHIIKLVDGDGNPEKED